MKPGGKTGFAFGASIAVLASLLVCQGAAAATPASFGGGDTVFSGTTIALKGGADQEMFSNVLIWGRIPIPGPNQVVRVDLSRDGEPAVSHDVLTDPATGRYKLRFRLRGCCDYVAQATHGTDSSPLVGFEAKGPEELTPGPVTLRFNRLLAKNGFHIGEINDYVDDQTGLAVLALRKTNELPLSESYAPKLYQLLMSGHARFVPEHDDPGRHVEVDVSRQVMALVEDGKATDVFHVSTGAGGTPRGEWEFYEKSPGYNAKGMYYSIYYDGNYATHGYYTVPYYPASHGCTRNPEMYSVWIYNWISLGDKMYVYD